MLDSNMSAFAAQSTVDVPVSAKQKDSALDELLGANVLKVQREQEYVIGHGDILAISLYEEGDMSASAALKKLYTTIYDNPIVIATLIQSNSLRYTVMGKVLTPGIFKLEHPTTLVQVVAQAGVFNEWAGKEITVVRKDLSAEDKKHFKGNTLKFEYTDFVAGKDLEQNIFVRSGDIVIID